MSLSVLLSSPTAVASPVSAALAPSASFAAFAEALAAIEVGAVVTPPSGAPAPSAQSVEVSVGADAASATSGKSDAPGVAVTFAHASTPPAPSSVAASAQSLSSPSQIVDVAGAPATTGSSVSSAPTSGGATLSLDVSVGVDAAPEIPMKDDDAAPPAEPVVDLAVVPMLAPLIGPLVAAPAALGPVSSSPLVAALGAAPVASDVTIGRKDGGLGTNDSAKLQSVTAGPTTASAPPPAADASAAPAHAIGIEKAAADVSATATNVADQLAERPHGHPSAPAAPDFGTDAKQPSITVVGSTAIVPVAAEVVAPGEPDVGAPDETEVAVTKSDPRIATLPALALPLRADAPQLGGAVTPAASDHARPADAAAGVTEIARPSPSDGETSYSADGETGGNQDPPTAAAKLADPLSTLEASPDSFDAVANATSRASSAQPAAAPQTPAQVAAAIVAAVPPNLASAGSSRRTRFDVQLDEGDLGRIDVRLDISSDGRVSTRLIVDRPETLNLLRQDAGELTRTLEQAGFKLTGDGPSFELRDGSSDAWRRPTPVASINTTAADDDLAVRAAPLAYAGARAPSSALDMRV